MDKWTWFLANWNLFLLVTFIRICSYSQLKVYKYTDIIWLVYNMLKLYDVNVAVPFGVTVIYTLH